jgi:hypothetical protein
MRFLAIAVSETTKPGTSLNMLSMNNVLQRFTRPKSVSLGNLQIVLYFKIGSDNVDQLIRGHGLVGGWFPLRIEHVKSDMIRKKLGHQPIHRTSRSGDEPQNIGTVVFFCESSLHGFNLATDSPNPQNELSLFCDCVNHRHSVCGAGLR